MTRQSLADRHIKNAIERPIHAYLIVGDQADRCRTTLDLASQLLGSSLPGDSQRWIYQVNSREGKKLGIDQVKDAIRFANQSKPSTVKNKLIIIDCTTGLSSEATNALLLTLEEPPRDTIFILVAESTEHLYKTILSRVQTIRLDRSRDSGEASEIAKQFIKMDLVSRLLIAGHINNKDEAEQLINDLSRLAIANNDNALHRGESLLLAQTHLYNSGNPKFVLECLALEYE